MWNLVQPKCIKVILSGGPDFAIVSAGNRGAFGSGLQSIDVPVACSLSGETSGQSHRAGIASRTTTMSCSGLSPWASSAYFQRAAGSGKFGP